MRRNPRESLGKFRGGYLKKTGISLLSMIVSKTADLLTCLSAYFKRKKKKKRTGEVASRVKTAVRFTPVFSNSGEHSREYLNSDQEEDYHPNLDLRSAKHRVRQPHSPRDL